MLKREVVLFTFINKIHHTKAFLNHQYIFLLPIQVRFGNTIPSFKSFLLFYFQQRYLNLHLSVSTVHGNLPLGNGVGKFGIWRICIQRMTVMTYKLLDPLSQTQELTEFFCQGAKKFKSLSLMLAKVSIIRSLYKLPPWLCWLFVINWAFHLLMHESCLGANPVWYVALPFSPARSLTHVPAVYSCKMQDM